MSDSEHKCSDGWNLTQLLSYVDGELDESTRHNLEDHLSQCPTCSRELENLHSIGCLLKEHPESFHPTEEDLYDFVCRGDDTHSSIAEHLLSCASCRDEEKILREMVEEQVTLPGPRPVLPEELRLRLRRIAASTSPKIADRLVSRMVELIRLPFRTRFLAFSSAAAVLIIAIVGVIAWRSSDVGIPQFKPEAPPIGVQAIHGETGPSSSLPDDSETVHRKAAEQGDPVAQYNLGNTYRDGAKVPKDDRQAVKWYRKAAEQGLAQAQMALGAMYMDGRGVPLDHGEAAKWYQKAAEQSLAAAQYNLGRMYENGWGVSKNYQEAAKWYRKAAAQGHHEAKQALARLLE
jgi:anti-sigma factor RsiW